MADNRVNEASAARTLGIIGLIIGITGGAFGLAEIVGRDKDIAALKASQTAQEIVNRDRESRISKLEARWDSIEGTLSRIESKLDKHLGQ